LTRGARRLAQGSASWRRRRARNGRRAPRLARGGTSRVASSVNASVAVTRALGFPKPRPAAASRLERRSLARQAEGQHGRGSLCPRFVDFTPTVAPGEVSVRNDDAGVPEGRRTLGGIDGEVPQCSLLCLAATARLSLSSRRPGNRARELDVFIDRFFQNLVDWTASAAPCRPLRLAPDLSPPPSL